MNQPAATNSMHLQSTHTPHSQCLQSDPHLESGRRSVGEFFCGNSLRVNVVGCFRRGAPSLMFDGILNVTLSEEKVSTTGVTQGNLNSSCILILFIHTKHRYKKMKSWTDPTSSSPWRRTHLLGRQGKIRVTNSWGAAHKSWIVKCSPRAPRF